MVAELFLRRGNSRYNIYAITAFVFGACYIAFACFILFVPKEGMSIVARDYANGIFLAATLFGTPVVILLGLTGMIYTRLEHKQGFWMGIFAISAVIVFLWAQSYYWYQQDQKFWDFNFNNPKKAQELQVR